MKRIADVLREADPLAEEVPPTEAERAIRRQAILNAQPRPSRGVSRRTALTAIAAVAIVGVATGTRYWSQATDLIAAVRFEVHLAELEPAPGLRKATVAGNGRTIYLHDESVVTNADVAEAHIAPGNPPDGIGIALTFTPGGSAKMARATEGHIGRPMAIMIDGEVVMAPTVRSVTSTDAVITGNYTRAEADRIVAGIIGR